MASDKNNTYIRAVMESALILHVHITLSAQRSSPPTLPVTAYQLRARRVENIVGRAHFPEISTRDENSPRSDSAVIC